MLRLGTSALLKQRPLPQSLLGKLAPKTATGEFGKTSLPMLKESTATSRSSLNQSNHVFSKFSRLDLGEELSHPAAATNADTARS